MRKIFFALSLLLVITSCEQNDKQKTISSDTISVIPQPQSIEAFEGLFTIDKNTKIQYQGTLKNVASALSEQLHSKNEVQEFKAEINNQILLSVVQNEKLKKEGYELTIDKNGIKIEGDAAGVFYGIQTLAQLLADAGSDLYKSLSKVLKSSYDDLVAKGLNAVEEAGVIKFLDNSGSEIARISNNEFIPTKWTAYYKGEIISKTETGHWLIKNGDEYGFDLGYKDGRVLTSEQVNTYHKGIGNHSPYKPLNKVFERDLQIGDKVYIVEYKYPQGSSIAEPNPGGWGSKNKITTIKELREDLAVLEGWKDASQNGGLVVREYTIKKLLPVRDGVVGPLQEVGDMATAPIYRGGEQQYEFMKYLGNGEWENYLSIKNKKGVELLND